MNLYLLTRINGCEYDEYNKHLIRAESAKKARKIANTNPADEGRIWEDAKKFPANK